MQKLDLVDRRFDALLSGEKTDTIRLGEGEVVPGFLVYESYPSKDRHAVVLVTRSRYMELRKVLLHAKDERNPDETTLLKNMRTHYPEIALDTRVLFVEHLTPEETQRRHPEDVKRLLEEVRPAL